MNKTQLHRFIKDTRGLIRGAPVEKKVKLLKLIKEAKRRCEESELNEMDLDREKIKDSLDSKFSTASLAGALKACGATTDISNGDIQNTDYLEEK